MNKKKAVILFLTVIVAVGLTLGGVSFLPSSQPEDNIDKMYKLLSKLDYVEVITAKQYFNKYTKYNNGVLEFSNNPNKIIVILIHAINDSTELNNMIKYKSLEETYGLRSSIYVRPWAEDDYYISDNILMFKQWEREGWEIGFLYDTLSKVNKNIQQGVTRVIYADGTVEEYPTPLKEDMKYEETYKRFKYELSIMEVQLNITTLYPYISQERSDIDNSWLYEYYREEMIGNDIYLILEIPAEYLNSYQFLTILESVHSYKYFYSQVGKVMIIEV